MYSPDDLFIVCRSSPIVAKFVNHWRCGALEWEDMLIRLAHALERHCNDLANDNKIREKILEARKKSVFPSLPNYVLETSLVPQLLDTDDLLQRQSKLIESIVVIDKFLKLISEIVLQHKRLSPEPTIFIKQKDAAPLITNPPES